MDDIKLAMLGDREAAKRLTEAGVLLMQGDCLELLKDIPDGSVDMILCDPPYRDQSENRPTKDMRKNGTMKNFGNKPNENFFKELFRVSKEQVIWGANNFYLPNYKGFLVWEKTNVPEDFTMSMAEIAYISEGLGTISKIFKHSAQGTPRHASGERLQ